MTSSHLDRPACELDRTTYPRVAIIIVNYNGQDVLKKYLPSVTNLNYPNYQVIVVDNDSSDGSVDFLRSEFPDICVVENEENVGLARGNNRGADTAPEADYYWFLNPDVRVPESSLTSLIEYIETASDVGVVVPRINEIDSDTIQSLGYHYDLTGRSFRRYEGKQTPPTEEPHEVPYGMLAALLVSQEAWQDVGGFDPENFIYGDDDYLCLQAWLRGHHVEVVPDSAVHHVGGASKAPSPFDVYHNARSRTRCYLKTLQFRSILLGAPLYFGRLGAQAVKDLLVRRSPKTASSRLAGLANALAQLPDLYRDRKSIQSERVYPDSRFLSRFLSE